VPARPARHRPQLRPRRARARREDYAPAGALGRRASAAAERAGTPTAPARSSPAPSEVFARVDRAATARAGAPASHAPSMPLRRRPRRPRDQERRRRPSASIRSCATATASAPSCSPSTSASTTGATRSPTPSRYGRPRQARAPRRGALPDPRLLLETHRDRAR
jgi:hypothetical protein